MIWENWFYSEISGKICMIVVARYFQESFKILARYLEECCKIFASYLQDSCKILTRYIQKSCKICNTVQLKRQCSYYSSFYLKFICPIQHFITLLMLKSRILQWNNFKDFLSLTPASLAWSFSIPSVCLSVIM